MSLAQTLNESCIRIGAEAGTKQELLRVIAEIAAGQKPLQDAGISEEAVSSALMKRESIGSTGLSDGVAIPHCSFRELQDFTAGIIITSKPLDFDAVDGKPSQLFFFLIGPEQARNQHIRYISAVSKAAREEEVRKQLLQAADPSAVLTILKREIPDLVREEGQGKKSQITLYIQREEYFSEILEVLSSETAGSIAVFETENAGRYLYRMPLFAAFWDSSSSSFNRVITAVLDTAAVNQTIRKIQDLLPDMDTHSGILITVQELTYAVGSIDF